MSLILGISESGWRLHQQNRAARAPILNVEQAASLRGATWKEEYQQARQQLAYGVVGNIAVFQMRGVMVKDLSVPGWFYGDELSTPAAAVGVMRATADPKIEQILVVADSPGGQVSGTNDLVEALAQAAEKKPLIALIEDQGCSCMYWALSQADAIFAGRTAEVGALGVWTAYVDASRMFENAGVTVKTVKSAENKPVYQFGEQVPDAVKQHLQQVVNTMQEITLADVSRGRLAAGIDAKKVSDLGHGQVLVGQQAVDAGFIDGISNASRLLLSMQQNAPQLISSKRSSTLNATTQAALTGAAGAQTPATPANPAAPATPASGAADATQPATPAAAPANQEHQRFQAIQQACTRNGFTDHELAGQQYVAGATPSQAAAAFTEKLLGKREQELTEARAEISKLRAAGTAATPSIGGTPLGALGAVQPAGVNDTVELSNMLLEAAGQKPGKN